MYRLCTFCKHGGLGYVPMLLTVFIKTSASYWCKFTRRVGVGWGQFGEARYICRKIVTRCALPLSDIVTLCQVDITCDKQSM